MRDARRARWRGQAGTAPEPEARRGTLLGLLEKVWSVNKTLSPVAANSRLAVSLFLFPPSFRCGTQELNSGSVHRAGGGMMHVQVLRLSLVLLAGWALSTASSEPGWTRKRYLAQRGRLNQVPSEDERCWLGATVRRPRAAPQYHLFGVYPSRPGNYLGPYPVGDQGAHHAGRSQPAAEGAAVSHVPPDPTTRAGMSSEAEQPAAPWVGDGPIGQSELLGDDDTHLEDGGSKESLGEAGTQDCLAPAVTIPSSFAHRKEPKPETRRKGRAKTRRRRQVVKGRAEGAWRDPDASPRHFQPWPKRPLVPGVRTSPLEDSVQNGEGDPSREAETSNPHGGGLPVLYFSGRRERLLLRPEVLAEIPREAFTVEAWVKPEGGQNNPAVIAGNNPFLGLLWSSGYGRLWL